MRKTKLFVLALALVLLLPGVLDAATVLRPYDPATETGRSGEPVRTKLDIPANLFLVPYYEVDTTNPSGTTTLFAARNTSDASVDIDITYFNFNGDALRVDTETLGPRRTLTRNVRDVAGLPIDMQGIARGYIVIDAVGAGDEVLVGDYLQADVANDFATGDRLLSLFDLCEEQEIRYLDFGSGTRLTLVILASAGGDPQTDDPSVIITPVGEDGAIFPAVSIYTDADVVQIEASDIAPTAFGTMIFDFSNATAGAVIAEYSADGKFSVGMNGACRTPLGGI